MILGSVVNSFSFLEVSSSIMFWHTTWAPPTALWETKGTRNATEKPQWAAVHAGAP